MARRPAAPADDAQIAEVMTQTYRYLRGLGAIAPIVEDWTPKHVAHFRNAGYDFFVFEESSGRVDSFVCYGLEQHTRNRVTEPWMVLKFLGVRMDTITDTTDRRTHLLRATSKAIPDAIAKWGVVGVMTEFDKRWLDLKEFIDTWAGIEYEESEFQTRMWWRWDTGRTEFEARTKDIERARR